LPEIVNSDTIKLGLILFCTQQKTFGFPSCARFARQPPPRRNNLLAFQLPKPLLMNQAIPDGYSLNQ